MGILKPSARKLAALSIALLLLLEALGLTLVDARAQPADPRANLVVVVSSLSKTRSLSLATVRSIFLGTPTYSPDGEAYIPFTQSPESPSRVAFDLQFLGMSPDAVGRYWVDQRIRARITPPRSLPSVDVLRRVVATLPQAVSYIRADQLAPGIVPVAIDDIDFRDPRYRYRMSQLEQLSSASRVW